MKREYTDTQITTNPSVVYSLRDPLECRRVWPVYLGRVAELADALGSGSSELRSWGFKSPLAHQTPH